MMLRLAYSLREAAQALSLSVRSLRYLIKTGKLGFAKVGRRVLIPHGELERLLRQASVKPTQLLDADESIRPAAGNGNAPEVVTPEASSVRAGGKPAPADRCKSHGT